MNTVDEKLGSAAAGGVLRMRNSRLQGTTLRCLFAMTNCGVHETCASKLRGYFPLQSPMAKIMFRCAV